MTELSDPIILKNIITTVSPLIKSVVDNFVTPKLLSMKSKFKLDYNKYHIPTEEHFSEYFHRTYKKLSILNTLVFNNSQRLLKDIYIPLTISEGRNSPGIKLDNFPAQLIEEYEKVLITDTAGMGKSTLMKRFFIDVIDNKIGVPIFLELRRLNDDKTIIQEIHSQINSIDKEFDEQLLLEFINEGGFIFILDGYDEISLKDRKSVTKDIQDFINKASNNRFLLTSRPENALSSFGDFKNFIIQPLKKKEAFELLRKYDGQRQISSLLIKKLEESHMANIEEFLTNPLLVSLLFLAFQYKQTIPFKKHLFYRQVYDANFESHDLTKGESYTHDKYTELEVDDFHRVLRHIGFHCFKEQKIEFTKDEFLKVILRSKKFCVGLEFKESDFLNDLIVTVPLFTKDGNYYRWAHKSLQEYFAAQFMYLDMDDEKSQFLMSLYNHKEFEKFTNVLDLFYDMDYKTFRNVILYEFLIDYQNYFSKACQCFDSSVPNALRSLRKELCYNKKVIFLSNPKDKDDLKDISSVIFKYGSSNNEFGIRFSSIAFGRVLLNISYIQLIEPHESLKTILVRKKHNIIRSRNLEPISVNNEAIFRKLMNKYTDNFEITRCKDNPFNTPEYFELGNDVIRHANLKEGIVDYEKSMALLTEIKNDLREADRNYMIME